MDWDQIESKWAAMTRRVRTEWSTDRIEVKTQQLRRVARADVAPAIITDRQTAKTTGPALKISAE